MDFKLDTNGDLAIEHGDLVLISGVEAVAQEIWIRLRFFLGEWFLDKRIGMPYFEKILGEKPRLSVVRSIFRDAILSTPGMISLSDLVVTYDGATRKINVSFTGTSTAGIVPFDREFIIT